jgi:hypothetical protein
MKSATFMLGLAVGAVLVWGTPAWSDKKDEHGSGMAALAKDATVTIEQAIKTANERVPGTVVEAELEKKHGKTVWEVDVLGADGQITEVHIEAATGTVIDTESKGAKHEHTKDGKKKGKD